MGVGQRQTRQREAILEAIRGAAGPITIPQIHRDARGVIGSLGLATVYRTVKLLLEADLVRSVILPEGEARYEDAGLGHHHHFRCVTCDQVYDLDVCPVSLPEGTTLPGGFRVESHELVLYGTCPQCGAA